jgi:hypothetical protein
VKAGTESFILTWNTASYIEDACTLTGSGIGANPLNPTLGNPYTGSTTISSIMAQSTYTLQCGTFVDQEVVKVIPITYEE